MNAILALLLIILCAAIYFLPSIVGSGKRNIGAIIVLNLFLGWTLIGWVIALVWASTSDDPPPTVITNNIDRDDSIERLHKLKGLLDSGAINEGEFEREKAKIL